MNLDVSLLSDIIIEFRNICLKKYGLETGNYLSSPGLALDACLKLQKKKGNEEKI